MGNKNYPIFFSVGITISKDCSIVFFSTESWSNNCVDFLWNQFKNFTQPSTCNNSVILWQDSNNIFPLKINRGRKYYKLAFSWQILQKKKLKLIHIKVFGTVANVLPNAQFPIILFCWLSSLSCLNLWPISFMNPKALIAMVSKKKTQLSIEYRLLFFQSLSICEVIKNGRNLWPNTLYKHNNPFQFLDLPVDLFCYYVYYLNYILI